MPVSVAIGADRTGLADAAADGRVDPRAERTRSPRTCSRRCAAPTPPTSAEQMLERTDSEGAGRDRRPAVRQAVLDPRSSSWWRGSCCALLHRVIDRFVASLSGQNEPTRRIKRTLRRTPIVAQTLPDSVLDTGTVSIRPPPGRETLGHVLHSIAAFAVWSIAVITILGELGINLGPLIAGAGIAGVALGFGAQSLVKDFLAGIFILVEDQYGVGDIIDVGELSGTPVTGTVESVSLRATRAAVGERHGVARAQRHRPARRQHEPAVGPGRCSTCRWPTAPTSTWPQADDQAGRRRAVAGPGVGGPGARGARGVGRREPGARRRRRSASW